MNKFLESDLHIKSNMVDIENIIGDYTPTDEKTFTAIKKVSKVVFEVEKTIKKNPLEKIIIIGPLFSKILNKHRLDKLTDIKEVVKALSSILDDGILSLEQDCILFNSILDGIEKELPNKRNKLEELKILRDNEKDTDKRFLLDQIIMDGQQLVMAEENCVITLSTLIKNNIELGTNVKRLRNTTLQVLANAILIQSQLDKQERLLRLSREINKETGNILVSSSTQLREQGKEIQKQSIENLIDQKAIQKSIELCHEAYQEIVSYKKQKLPSIELQIAETTEMLSKTRDIVKSINSLNKLVS